MTIFVQERSHSRRNRAFTLMEMVLVLAIIALLVGIGAMSMQNILGGAEVTATQGKLRALESALVSYKSNAMMFPTTEQGLDALMNRPTSGPKPKMWMKKVNSEGDLQDAWNRPFKYESPGTHNPNGYDLWSMGADGQDGTEDDVKNWGE